MNRFDLEQSIMSCWGTKEDISLISERFLEDEEMSKDSIFNALEGLAALHDLRCKKLFETFELMISTGGITNAGFEEFSSQV